MGDHKEITNFKDIVIQHLNTLPPLEDRKRIILEINEDYFNERGTNLPGDLLNLLGYWLLREQYADRAPHKVKYEEYPILSKYQIQYRKNKTVLISDNNMLSNIRHNNGLFGRKK